MQKTNHGKHLIDAKLEREGTSGVNRAYQQNLSSASVEDFFTAALSMLRQNLADVGLLEGESDDEEFVASFALQILVLECPAAWALRKRISSTFPPENVDRDLCVLNVF